MAIPKIYVDIPRKRVYLISNIFIYAKTYDSTVYSNPVIMYVNIIDTDIQDKVFYVLDAEAYDKENGDVTVDKSQIIEPSTLIVNKIKQS